MFVNTGLFGAGNFKTLLLQFHLTSAKLYGDIVYHGIIQAFFDNYRHVLKTRGPWALTVCLVTY